MDRHIPLMLLKERLRRIRQAKGSESVFNFARIYFDHVFPFPFCSFHHALFEDLSVDSPNKRMVRIAPRGHGKSTLVSLVYVIWCLVFQKKLSILLIGSNQSLANDKLQDIITELEGNDLLREDFPVTTPKRDRKNQYTKYTDSHVVFHKNIQLIARGMGTAIRGIKPRPDLIIIDDPEKDADLTSSSTRDKHKRWFDQVIRYLGGPGKTLDIIAIDTLKHYDSLIHYLFTKPGWDAKKYSAVVDDQTHQVLWDAVYCYHVDDLTPWEREHFHLRGSDEYATIRQPFYGSLEHTHPQKMILGLAEENADAFRQEFLSQPVLHHQMPLRKELWRTFIFTKELIHELPYKLAAIDLSMGKEGGDYQALCVLGATQKDYYLLDAALLRLDLVKHHHNEESLVNQCILFIKQYQLRTFVVEDNGAQALFINTLRRALAQEQIECYVRGFRASGDKHERIQSILGLVVQRGSFYIRDDYSQKYPQFLQQFEYFPKADHDDAPDVTTMAIVSIQRLRG